MKKKKNGNQKVIVELRSGKKIEVNRYEQIELPDGRKVEITKVSPFNKLLQHKYIPRKESAKRYNIKILPLPKEANQDWPKAFWIGIDAEAYEKNRIIDVCLAGKHYGDKKDLFRRDNSTNVQLKPILASSIFYKSMIFISENYDRALPVTTNYRRCPFCLNPDCIIEENTLIRSHCERRLSKYKEHYLIEYSLCRKYERSFVSILQNKKIGERRVICKLCGSGSLSLRETKEYFKISEENNKMVYKDLMFDPAKLSGIIDKSTYYEEDCNPIFCDIDKYDLVYECKQCRSVFDKNGRILLRPFKWI